MTLAKCILKQAEKPPLFIETTKNARIAAAKELLGRSTSPEFFSLTPDNSFVIAYDFYGLFRDQPVNFFVTPPVGKNRPVLPIIGDAIIFRCEPITDFTQANQDYILTDCTEEDMEYVRTGLLKNAIQTHLFRSAEEAAKEVAKAESLQNAALQLLISKFSRWAKTHDRADENGYIGKAVNAVPVIPRSKEQELQDKPFYETSFIRYCEGWGLECTCPDRGLVHIKSKSAYWKVWHTSCYVTRLKQSRIVIDINSGKLETEEFQERSIPERDIYSLAKYISKLGKYGLS